MPGYSRRCAGQAADDTGCRRAGERAGPRQASRPGRRWDEQAGLAVADDIAIAVILRNHRGQAEGPGFDERDAERLLRIVRNGNEYVRSLKQFDFSFSEGRALMVSGMPTLAARSFSVGRKSSLSSTQPARVSSTVSGCMPSATSRWSARTSGSRSILDGGISCRKPAGSPGRTQCPSCRESCRPCARPAESGPASAWARLLHQWNTIPAASQKKCSTACMPSVDVQTMASRAVVPAQR